MARRKSFAEKPRREKHCDDCRRIGPDAHESGVAEGKLPGISVHEIQTDGESDIDTDGHDDPKVIGIDPVGKPGEHEGQKNGTSQREMCREVFHQTFSTWTFPRIPAGLKT